MASNKTSILNVSRIRGRHVLPRIITTSTEQGKRRPIMCEPRPSRPLTVGRRHTVWCRNGMTFKKVLVRKTTCSAILMYKRR